MKNGQNGTTLDSFLLLSLSPCIIVTLLTFLFSFGIFISVIFSTSIVQTFYYYSFPGNTTYVPVNCIVLLICAYDV